MSGPETGGPRRVALTGGIGTGKSTVRAAFAARGVPTIDADALARSALAPGTPGLAAVVARFGPGVLDAAGTLDRSVLAGIVFADPAARLDLEAIVHPPVREATERWFASLANRADAFAIADIPLLYETGRDRDFNVVIVAACQPETQLARVMARDGATAADVQRRIASQLPLEEKIRRANYVIRTDGTLEDIDAEVQALHERLMARP
jgi:dephospho-CoA kinase